MSGYCGLLFRFVGEFPGLVLGQCYCFFFIFIKTDTLIGLCLQYLENVSSCRIALIRAIGLRHFHRYVIAKRSDE